MGFICLFVLVDRLFTTATHGVYLVRLKMTIKRTNEEVKRTLISVMAY